MGDATKNFHLPLPQTLYAELRSAAEATGVPATRLAQELVRQGLDERRRAERRRQVAMYAAAVAGTDDDLDAVLEAAGLEALRTADR